MTHLRKMMLEELEELERRNYAQTTIDCYIQTIEPRLADLSADRQRTGKAHGELRARRKDGSLFPIEISSVFTSSDGDSRTRIIIRDITERAPPKPNVSA